MSGKREKDDCNAQYLCRLVATSPFKPLAFGNERDRTSSAPASRTAVVVHEGIVDLTNSKIEYFSQGQGEPIVLLPFGELTVGYMSDLSRDLAVAGYQVIRMNFRGSGKSMGSGQEITLHYVG